MGPIKTALKVASAIALALLAIAFVIGFVSGGKASRATKQSEPIPQAMAPEVSKPIDPDTLTPYSPEWVEAMDQLLTQHDPKVFSFVPAKGYVDGVAGVLRDNHLYVNTNSDIYFFSFPQPEKNRPAGLYIDAYIARARPSGQYKETDGAHALWFKGENDQSFMPWNDLAQHISDNDRWIKPGGPLDDWNK